METVCGSVRVTHTAERIFDKPEKANGPNLDNIRRRSDTEHATWIYTPCSWASFRMKNPTFQDPWAYERNKTAHFTDYRILELTTGLGKNHRLE